MAEIVTVTFWNSQVLCPFFHRWKRSKTKDPWAIVGAGRQRGERRRVLRLAKGQRGSTMRTSQLLEQWDTRRANLERVLPPEEGLGRSMDQRDTLDDSQCLDELRCDSLRFILFVL